MKKLKVFVGGILGGISISIGGVAFLSVDSKIIGSLLFAVGLFTICTFGFDLFTGKVCYSLDNKPGYLLDLLVIWLGNLAGAWLTAVLIGFTRNASISERAASMCQVKLADSLPSVFILAVFCNILIYIAVDGYKKNPHECGKYLSLIFGVAVFIICGFEHCVANMFYISMAGAWSGKALVFILVNTLGNAVGGLLLPLLAKLRA